MAPSRAAIAQASLSGNGPGRLKTCAPPDIGRRYCRVTPAALLSAARRSGSAASARLVSCDERYLTMIWVTGRGLPDDCEPAAAPAAAGVPPTARTVGAAGTAGDWPRTGIAVPCMPAKSKASAISGAAALNLAVILHLLSCRSFAQLRPATARELWLAQAARSQARADDVDRELLVSPGFRGRLLALGHCAHLIEDTPAGRSQRLTGFDHAPGIDVHIVPEAAEHRAVGGHLEHRRDRAAGRRAAAGSEYDDLRATRYHAGHRLRVVARRIHHDQAAARRPAGIRQILPDEGVASLFNCTE